MDITFSEDFLGEPYTIIGGNNESYYGVVPSSLHINQTVETLQSKYTISCDTQSGITYSEILTTRDFYGIYETRLNAFNVTIEISTNAGATVIATIGDRRYYSGVADDNGYLNLLVNSPGIYSIYAYIGDNYTSNVSAVINNNGQSVSIQLPNLYSRLPIGYQEVEYIEGNGTQYINTLFVPNNNMCINGEFQLTTTSGTQTVFGTNVIGSAAALVGVIVESGKFKSICNYNNQVSKSADTNRHTFVMDRVLDVQSIDSTSGTTGSVSTSNSLFIFAYNEGGPTKYLIGKVYSFDIKVSSDYVMRLVPCYKTDTNDAGMYDLIGGTFFWNSGTGKFIAGAIV